jgi:SAM-dependent methyltransferase
MLDTGIRSVSGMVLFGGAHIGAAIPNRIIVGSPDPGDRDIAIVTGPEQWSYALELPPSADIGCLERPIAVCIEIHVRHGIVGVAAQNLSGTKLIAEWWAKPTNSPVIVILPIPEPREFGGLVFRNAAAGHNASAALVGSIAAYELAMEGPDVFAGAQDHLSALTEQRIAAEFQQGGFAILREKWAEIPNHGVSRISSLELNTMSDSELLEFYDSALDRVFKTVPTGERLIQNWYYAVYAEAFRGKRVLDVGSGAGFDALWFAARGADCTCLDIAESNTENIRRIAGLRGLNIKTQYLTDFDSFDKLGGFDVIWCNGSMINAPFAFAVQESSKLLEHLPVGGRWIELGYPRQRWEREGHLPLHRWGERTDGIGTPWMEWYDTPKLMKRLANAHLDVFMAFDYALETLNWFDLQRWG